MSFEPSLATTSRLPISSSSSKTTTKTTTTTVYFTYTPSSSSSSKNVNFVPEVWTNLPNTEVEDNWHAIPFLSSSNSSTIPNESNNQLVAQVEVPNHKVEGKNFEFTYRLKRKRNDDDDGESFSFEWLGYQGGNGTIQFYIKENEEGEWSHSKNGKVLKGRFTTTTSSTFDLTEKIESWRNRRKVEGLTLEQSSRTWFTPRLFPPSETESPLCNISHQFISQLILLRTIVEEEEEERYLVIFPFSSTCINSSLIGSDSGGRLLLRCERDATQDSSNEKEKRGGGVVIVKGSYKEDDDFNDLIKLAIESARESLYPESTSTSTPTPPKQVIPSSSSPPKDLVLCTWNALGPDFTLSGLLSWLDKVLSPEYTSKDMIEIFKRGGLMLDDGWQDSEIFNRDNGQDDLRGLRGFGVRKGWYDLEGELTSSSRTKSRGWELTEAVKKIKSKGIERVGVWITITGYWNCLHPDFKDENVNLETTLASFSSPQHDNFHFTASVPSLTHLRLFFRTYFSRISSSGINFIKIDNQALVDSIVKIHDDTPAGTYRAELLKVLQEESFHFFGKENVIHCMAHSTRIWSGPLALQSNGGHQQSSLRNSDDYFPFEKDSHRWHIYINSINLLLTRHLFFDPDLDMCQELHEWGSFHLVLRAFSTARIWSTDTITEEEGGEKLGEKRNGWKRLLATSLNRGVQVLQAREQAASILSSQVLSREITDRSREGGGEALKIGLKSQRARGGTIGFWNCQKDGPVKASLKNRDVWEIVKGWEETVPSKEDLVVFIDESFGPTPTSLPSTTDSKPRSIVKIIPIDSIDPRKNSYDSFSSSSISTVELPSRAVQLATIAETYEIGRTKGGGSTIRVACLGLRDKFVGLEAIRKISIIAQTIISPPLPESSLSLNNDSLTCSSSSNVNLGLNNNFPTPPPNTHLPFLLTYFSNFFVSPSSSTTTKSNTSSSSSLAPQHHPLDQTRSKESSSALFFFKSLLKRPISTIFNEVRGIFTFGIAVVVWAFKSRRGRTRGGIDLPTVTTNEKQSKLPEAEEGTADQQQQLYDSKVSSSSSSTRLGGRRQVEKSQIILQIEFEFISSQVAFYFSPTLTSAREIEFKLDGKIIDEKFIVQLKEEFGIVQVDIEGFWEENGKRKKLGSQVWIVEVAYTKCE